MRKILQLSIYKRVIEVDQPTGGQIKFRARREESLLVALCDDSTLWSASPGGVERGEWSYLPTAAITSPNQQDIAMMEIKAKLKQEYLNGKGQAVNLMPTNPLVRPPR